MIGYLKGQVIWANEYKVIISASGIGYEILYVNNITVLEYGSNISLFIASKYSEYGIALYGFKTIEEKLIFESLDNIKGVGSKVVYMIMVHLNIESYSDLQNIELDQLIKIPGVGKNTGQKFLLGLSNKLKKEFELGISREGKNRVDIEDKYNNEISLLSEWGMKKTDITKFLSENYDLINGKSSDFVIKLILKNFRK